MVQKFKSRHTLFLTLMVLLVALTACGTDTTPPTATALPAAQAAGTVARDSGATAMPAGPTESATEAPAMEMGPATVPPAEATATGTTATAGQATTSGATVQATLREWGLDLSQTEVAAGTVHFTIANTGMMAHNFTIKDQSGTVVAKTPNFSPAQSPQTLDVTLAAGTYTVYCSLPGHAARGQQNMLVVK